MPTLLLPVSSSLTPSSQLKQAIVAHPEDQDVVTPDALINQMPESDFSGREHPGPLRQDQPPPAWLRQYAHLERR